MAQLTDAQLTTLGAYLNPFRPLSDPEFADLLNTESVAFWVWRVSVPKDEYLAAIVWTEIDSLNANKARIWEWMTAQNSLPLRPADANVRAGLGEAFTVAQANGTRTALISVNKRLATNGEEQLASGTGTNASPADLAIGADGEYVESPFTVKNVRDALNTV